MRSLCSVSCFDLEGKIKSGRGHGYSPIKGLLTSSYLGASYDDCVGAKTTYIQSLGVLESQLDCLEGC